MNKNILIFLISLIGFTARSQWAYTVPNQDFKKFFSQRDVASNVPSAIDVNNSVFTTGYVGTVGTSANLVVIKYDSLGIMQYSSPYIYNNGGDDKGTAIKIDAFGFAYVAGNSYDATTGVDCVVMKLSPTGSLVWTNPARFDGGVSGGGIDEATDICVDANGDIYVTGRSQNINGDFDIVCIKIDGNTGSIIWQDMFNGSSLDDAGTSIVLSANGQYLYVTGNTTDPSNGTDLVAYALNTTSGTQYWAPVIIDGTANSNDKSNAIILHGADIALCGELDNSGTGLDYTTILLDGSSGSTIWQRNYHFSSNDRAASLVRDSTGNIGVVGTVMNGTAYEYHTVFYDNSGTQYAMNSEPSGLGSLLGNPKIVCDTIAHHWYVSGEKQSTTRDLFVYQIAPSGNTAWKQIIDGQNDIDGAGSIAVNGVGVVYAVAMSRNSFTMFDFMTVKINQTPVYFPPDLVTEEPLVNHLYYENRGQILKSTTMTPDNDIVFSTYDYYPVTYYKTNRISYKFKASDTIPTGNDTVQRIDITMLNANQLATAYPFEAKHGKMSFMLEGMPNAVTGVQGYERYFIPNIYPSIDLHYYSNPKGMKMYYVLKPQANPSNIRLKVDGSTSNAIVSGHLEIGSFNKKVVFDPPIIYTVDMAGNPVTVTTSIAWNSMGGDMYSLSIGSYSTGLPYIIEIDYGNLVTTTPASMANLVHSTYYGGWSDEGIKAIDVDQNTGNYVTVGETANSTSPIIFPVVSGSLVSTPTQTSLVRSFLTMVIFDQNGNRKAVNTYGIAGNMGVLDAVLNGNLITIVGNTSPLYTGSMTVINSSGALTPSAFTHTYGQGYVVQFRYVPNGSSGSINWMTWGSRLNGYGADIAKTPDGKHLYITSATNFAYSPIDLQSVAGSFTYGVINQVGSPFSFQIRKFDSLGIRSWSTLFPAFNSTFTNTTTFNKMNNNCNISLEQEYNVKCKIACDNYGFSLAGETNRPGLIKRNKYNVSRDSVFDGDSDAFFARFDKKDDLVYTTYVGGARIDAFTDITSANSKESIMVGYSNSDNYQKITTMPGGNTYVDSTITGTNSKILIAKFDTLGNKTWCTFYGGSGAFTDITGWAVASDLTGKTYVTGSDLGALTLAANNPPGVYYNNSVTSSESFMLSFNDVMNYPVWNTAFGGKREDVGLALDYNSKSGNVIQVGICNTTHSITFVAGETPWFPITQDQNNLTAYYQPWANGVANTGLQTTYDGFISTFRKDAIVGIDEYFKDKDNTEAFNLFPNPAQNECNIAFKQELKGKVKLEIYNQMGQLIASEERSNIIPYSILNLNTNNLVTGVYIVKVSDQQGTYSKKLIIGK